MKAPDSYIFKSVVRFSFFVINVFAIYLLLRGHNLPGGGFIGGLAAAISFVLLSLAIGVGELHRVMRFDPVRVATVGLLLAALTSAMPMLAGQPFLEHFNTHLHVPLLGDLHVGTPLLFDIGVFLVVVGVTCKIIFVFAKSTEGLRALVQEEEARYSSPRETPVEDDDSPEAVQEQEVRDAN
ncbi:MAG TPA: MnhB domain-containing protein [Verrucomicrobiota bacterium]|nr:MnhB domain-containing protein [Verrucomicrobiota bacterium]